MDINIGDRFGKLIIIGRDKDYIQPCGLIVPIYICKCDCGNITKVRKDSLIKGNTKSCGCIKSNTLIKRNTVHGLCKVNHRLYQIYTNMISRCYNKKAHDYKNYGARGIKICIQWFDPNYEKTIKPECIKNFFNWAIESGYNDNLTIERIDFNKDYCPENCIWATNNIQQNNRRNNHYIEFNGDKMSIHQLSHILGLNYISFYNKLYKNNFDINKVFCYNDNNIPYFKVYNKFFPINAIYFVDNNGYFISQDDIK